MPSLSAALRRRGWKSELMRVPLEPAADDVDLLLQHIPALGDREFVVVTRDAHLFPAQRDAVARILALAPDALIVSARAPYDVLLWPQARRVICIYGGQTDLARRLRRRADRARRAARRRCRSRSRESAAVR